MFHASTHHSGKLKALMEVLFSNSQDIVLNISKEGITSEFITVNDARIFVKLKAEGFDEYRFTFPEPIHVGLGSHVNSFFKTLKNNTNVTMNIDKPYVLDLSISGDDCTVKYSASFICAQNISPDLLIQYHTEKFFSVSSSTFNSMCKSFSKSPEITVSRVDGELSFSFALTGIASKSIMFGTKDITDKCRFFQEYKSDIFIRIGKLSSFTKIIKIFAMDNILIIEAESQLGILKVFLKATEE